MGEELIKLTDNFNLVEKREIIEKGLSILDRGEIGNNKMSPYQLINFVLSQEEYVTDFGRYKQAISEITSRIQCLTDLHLMHKKNQLEIDTLSYRNKTIEDDIKHKMLELSKFNEAAESLILKFDGKTEEELEAEYWKEKEKNLEEKNITTIAKQIISEIKAREVVNEIIKENKLKNKEEVK